MASTSNSNALPLLFCDKVGEKINFKSPSRGVSGKVSPFPYEDRNTHAEHLLEQFDEIARSDRKKKFSRLRIDSTTPDDLPLRSLDSSGMNLIDWEKNGEEEGHAIVLLPNAAYKRFRRKITDFKDKETTHGKPRNQKLVGRISAISKPQRNWFWETPHVVLPEDSRIWVEVWLRRNAADKERNASFEKICQTHKINYDQQPLVFPEFLVYVAKINRKEIEQLVEDSKDVYKCRACHELTSLVTNEPPALQEAWTQDILRRLRRPEESAPAVCVMDGGCNRHSILIPLISNETILSADGSEKAHDDDGHGTSMAGVAAYGNLNHGMMNAEGPLSPHPIESCRIYNLKQPQSLWGALTQKGVNLIEIAAPERTRVYCIAVTSDLDYETQGKPSSWSAALDAIASMSNEEGNGKRFFTVSAGNHDPAINDKISQFVHDPAQAWNVLTVGGVTHLSKFSETLKYGNCKLAAKDGELSPFSSNSTSWENSRPIKPDILCEGGNALIVRIGSQDCFHTPDDLCLLAPNWKQLDKAYVPFNGTSLAAALASNMAAQIMRKYPGLRAETIRALLVHSAEWTEEMKAKYLTKNKTHGNYLTLAKYCGHGEANISRATECMRNSLTMVHEGVLVPYKLGKDKNVVYNEMVYHDLPWPKETLLALGEEPVEMKVTLSYFIEPNPAACDACEKIIPYPSCRLKFSVRKKTDSRNTHLKKINQTLRKDNECISSNDQYSGWQLGSYAFAGSIHSDVWEGTAAGLAAMGGIAIFPESGWWKDRKALKRYNKSIPYSLVVSIRTTDLKTPIDLYSEVENQIKAQAHINIPAN